MRQAALDQAILRRFRDLLAEEQEAGWWRFEAWWRRSWTLPMVPAFAWGTVDLVRVVESLALDDDDDLAEDRLLLLDEYAKSFDAALADLIELGVSAARAEYDEKVERSVIDGDHGYLGPPADPEAWQSNLRQRRMRELQLNDRLAQINRNYGRNYVPNVIPAARMTDYLTALKRAIHPSLYTSAYFRRAPRHLDLLLGMEDLTEDQEDHFAMVMETYRARVAKMNDDVIRTEDELRRARLMLGPMQDGSAVAVQREQVIQAVAARYELENTTIDELRRILMEEQAQRVPAPERFIYTPPRY